MHAKKHFVKSAVLTLLCLAWSTCALAADPLRWIVKYQPDLHLLEIVVDTHPLPHGYLVAGAVFSVQLFDANDALIGERSFNFLDPAKLPVMEAGQVYERHFPLALPSVATVKAVALNWHAPSGGGRADTPGGSVKPSDSALPPATRRISDASPDFHQSAGAVNLVKGDGPAIFVVADGRRRHIPDMTTFQFLGFKLSDV